MSEKEAKRARETAAIRMVIDGSAPKSQLDHAGRKKKDAKKATTTDQTIDFAIAFASSRSLSDSRMITAVSSIARPVTSITGQPACVLKMPCAYSSSAFT